MLQLKDYFFPRVVIEANPNLEEGEYDLSGLSVKFEPTLHADEDYTVNLAIDIPISGNNVPYAIHVHAFGVFTYDGEESANVKAARAAMNGVNLLYTASREFIIAATSRGPYGAVTLPTRVFSSKDIVVFEKTHSAEKPEKKEKKTKNITPKKEKPTRKKSV